MTQGAVPYPKCLDSIPFHFANISGRHRNKIAAASCRYPASWQPHVILFAMVRLILCSHYVYYVIPFILVRFPRLVSFNVLRFDTSHASHTVS